MGSGEKRSGNVHQAVGNAEFKSVFRIRAIENKFGRFPFISQRKSLAVIEGSTNYIPVKQTVYFHRRVYSDRTRSDLREDVRHPCWLSLPLGLWCRAHLGSQKSWLNVYVEPQCLADPESSSMHTVRPTNFE